MDQKNNIVEFNKLIQEYSKGFGKNPFDFFKNLSDEGLTRIQLMIIDSSLKKMLHENSWKTLLILKQEFYHHIIKMTHMLINKYLNQ